MYSKRITKEKALAELSIANYWQKWKYIPMSEVIHSLMTSYILNYRSEIQCIPVVHLDLSVYFHARWCGMASTMFWQKVGLCGGKQKWYWRHKTACPRLWCIVLILHLLFMAGPLVIIWLCCLLSILCTVHDNILITCWSSVIVVLAHVPKTVTAFYVAACTSICCCIV